MYVASHSLQVVSSPESNGAVFAPNFARSLRRGLSGSAAALLASIAISPSASAESTSENTQPVAALTGNAAPIAASFTSINEAPSIIVDTEKAEYKGEGIWATTTGLGYFLRRTYSGDKIDVAVKSPSGRFDHGLITNHETGGQYCATVEDKFVEHSDTDTYNLGNPCRQFIGVLKDQPEEYLKDPNCQPGDCDDGDFMRYKAKCTHDAWDGLTPPGFGPLNMNGSEPGPGKVVGKERGPIYYRATFDQPDDRGRYFSIVRSLTNGWEVVRRKCIKFPTGFLKKAAKNFRK